MQSKGLSSLLQHHSSKASILRRSAFFTVQLSDPYMTTDIHAYFIRPVIANIHRVCAQSCLTLFDPMDCSLPGSSVHGIFQARTLEWVAISSSRGSSQPRDRTQVSCIADGLFTAEPLGKPNRVRSWPPLFHFQQSQYSKVFTFEL